MAIFFVLRGDLLTGLPATRVRNSPSWYRLSISAPVDVTNYRVSRRFRRLDSNPHTCTPLTLIPDTLTPPILSNCRNRWSPDMSYYTSE